MIISDIMAKMREVARWKISVGCINLIDIRTWCTVRKIEHPLTHHRVGRNNPKTEQNCVN